MKEGKNFIKVNRVKLNQESILVLTHTYGTSLYEHLKLQKNVLWSKSLKRFYVKDTHRNLLELVSKNKDYAEMDLEDLHRVDTDSKTNNTSNKARSKSKLKSATVPLSKELILKVREVKHYLEQQRYAASTINSYLSFLHFFFAQNPHLAWDEVNLENVNKYNHDHFIKNKRSYSAQNQWINAIKTYMKVHELGQLGEEIERPRRGYFLPNILTEKEVEKILKTPKNIKHIALLMLVYSGGLRIGEALSLKPEDIRSEEGLIYIRSAKGQKDRRVPLSKKLLIVLRQYFIAYQPQIYLFEGKTKGTPYSASSARKVLKKALQQNGIKQKITLHGLRHSFATHLTNRGVNIQYLQSILGHKSPKTTMIYTHLSGRDIKQIRSPLDDMNL